MSKQEPMLMESPLTKRVYVVTDALARMRRGEGD